MALTEDDDFSEGIDAATRPDDGGWVSRIEENIRACSEEWDLTIETEMQAGLVGYLVRATMGDGRPAVLKLREPGPAMEAEACAMALFDGRAAAEVYEVDTKRGALLLERVQPGEPLSRHVDTVDPNVAVAEVMANIGRDTTDLTLTTLSERAERWALNLERFTGDTPLGRTRVLEAAACIRELIATQGPNVVLHGDLHINNVLKGTRYPWVTVDPKGFIGEQVFDAGWWLRDPPPPQSGDWVAALRRRLDILESDLLLDRERMITWARSLVVILVAAREAGGMRFDSLRHAECATALDNVR